MIVVGGRNQHDSGLGWRRCVRVFRALGYAGKKRGNPAACAEFPVIRAC